VSRGAYTAPEQNFTLFAALPNKSRRTHEILPIGCPPSSGAVCTPKHRDASCPYCPSPPADCLGSMQDPMLIDQRIHACDRACIGEGSCSGEELECRCKLLHGLQLSLDGHHNGLALLGGGERRWRLDGQQASHPGRSDSPLILSMQHLIDVADLFGNVNAAGTRTEPGRRLWSCIPRRRQRGKMHDDCTALARQHRVPFHRYFNQKKFCACFCMHCWKMRGTMAKQQEQKSKNTRRDTR